MEKASSTTAINPAAENLFPNTGPRTYYGALQKAHTRDMFGCHADGAAVTHTQET